MSILRETNISRLPVIDKANKIEGLVDTIDLLKADTDRSRSELGEEAGEKIHLRHVQISSLMRKTPLITSPDIPLPKLINLMLEKHTTTALVEENGKICGLVTPKLILKLIGKRIEGVYVRISGLQKEDVFIKSVVDEEIRNEIRKLGKFLTINYMVLHVDRYRKTGKRIKYSVKGRLITEKGYFFADDHAWDITKAVRGVLQKLEKEAIKLKEKRIF
jgi:predicted transcriptional regulator